MLIILFNSNLFRPEAVKLWQRANQQVRGPNKGGIACCVPQCYNNNKRNKDLSFYVIPNKKIYPELWKKWLNAISRKNFDDPSEYHRVCSMHFAGGKKTYMNNISTIVPKFLKPTQHKKRTTANSSGQNRVNFSPVAEVDEENPHVELTSAEDLKNEITELKVTIAYLEEDIKEKIKLSEKDEIIAKSKFCIGRFKHNQVHFKFYAGFDSYGQFKCVLEYLQPAASMLSYWESGHWQSGISRSSTVDIILKLLSGS